MSQVVIQNQPVSLTIFLRTAATGVGATGLTFSAVTASYKQPTGTSFTSKSLNSGNFLEIGNGFYAISFVGQTNATATFGSGVNGTVTLSAVASAKGASGNLYTVQVVVPAGTSGISVSLVGTALTVNLAVSGGVATAANTATALAAAINAAQSTISAVASGTGASTITTASGPTSFIGGVDGELNQVGNVLLRASAASTDLSVESVLVIADTSAVVPTPNVPPNTTTVFGFLYDVNGLPLADTKVLARLVEMPLVQYQNSQSFTISAKPIVATSDSTGFFSLDLITGATFDVFISDTMYRRMIIVPTTNRNLFDIT